MNILILSITINWVYRLYEEYILSFKKFIEFYYKEYEIKINIHYINSLDFNIDNLFILNNEYDKIFYSGDISIFNSIYYKYYNLYEKFYYINIEQLSKESYFLMLRNIDTSVKIIDYSEENIVYLNELYENYLYPPFFKNFNIDISNKYIDVLSIVNNNYRKDIYNNIILDKKYNKIGVDNIYGFDRDEMFNKTKIYINIHSSEEHQTMELIRINNLIMRKVIVISQESVNSNLLFFKDYIINFNSIENLNIIIDDILNNYSNYYYKIYNNFNEKEKEYSLYIKNNINKLLF
jgi:hypothetical protein